MKKLKLIIYNFLIIILTTKCSFFQAPVKISTVEGKVFKKYTNEPLVGCKVSAYVPKGWNKTEELGETITDNNGKFLLKVITEATTYFVFFGSYNEPEFGLEFPPQVGLNKEIVLSNSQNHNISLPAVYPMSFQSDFHNTKPFDRNDKLVVEFYQNNIKKPYQETYLGDSLNFNPRFRSQQVIGNLYLKLRMFITKNNKLEIREDSIFCKPLINPTPATKRIEY